MPLEIIKNRQELISDSKTEEVKEIRRKILDIVESGIEAALPERVMKEKVKVIKNELSVCNRTFDLNKFQRIYVIGFGKASGFMASALEKILGDKITEGVVVVKEGFKVKTGKFEILYATHPIPSIASLEAAKKILEMAEKASKGDLIICLTSGGGSALFEYPREGVSLEELKRITELLLRSGANINEINTVRKRLSKVKGGKLARYTYPATVINLVSSDVVGNRLESIASGPLFYSENLMNPREILERYDLWKELSSHIKDVIQKEDRIDKEIFDDVWNFIILDNMVALKGAERKAMSLGFNTMILSSMITGESREVSRVMAEIAKEVEATGNPIKKPACIISGGETVVTVKGNGRGGRSQEFVLSFLKEMSNHNFIVAAVDTDGIDGNTDAAGSLADRDTMERAKKEEVDLQRFQDDNDSYHFFKMMNDLIITDQTGTNVNDLRVFVIF